MLQDIFESAHYRGCNNEPNAAPAAEQIAWLRKQLTEARASGQQVWVMAHIPPGIDVYTTYHRYLFAPGEACNVKQPQMFLSNNALGDTIAEFGDIVRLAIFAHTHMDEIKLLQGAGRQGGAGEDRAFDLADQRQRAHRSSSRRSLRRRRRSKTMRSTRPPTAQGAVWSREYRYSDVYHLPDFSAKSVEQLTSQLIDDKSGEEETSRAYERYFLAGGGTFAALGLQRLWPAYSCSLRELIPRPSAAACAPGRLRQRSRLLQRHR